MSEKFVASNGVEVRRFETRPGIWWDTTESEKKEAALREFFLHERDTELGRWRFNAYLVVYPAVNHQPRNNARSVNVLDERTGRLHMRHEGQVAHRETNPAFSEAAFSYFAAHPEPKPWHDAKPGEVWALTYGGQETAHVWTDRWAGQGNAFVSDRAIVESDDPDITAARRIWPEVVSDDS